MSVVSVQSDADLNVTRTRNARLVKTYLVTLLLVSSTIFNFKDGTARLFFVLMTLFIPFLLIMSKKSLGVSKKFKNLIVNTAMWLFVIFIWVFNNASEIVIELSGPAAEMLSPILVVGLVPALMSIESLNPEILRRAVRYFIFSLIIVLLSDIILRYVEEPSCFLNYDCRYEAKNAGFFSTTNALATSLIAVITAMMAEAKFRFGTKITLGVVLLTTMARAAIVAQAIIWAFQASSSRVTVITRYFLGFLSVLPIGVFFWIDPLNFFEDESAASKVVFVLATIEVLKEASVSELVFGFGGNYSKIIGLLGVNDWSPHIPFLKAFFYFGIPGVMLYFHGLFSICRFDKRLLNVVAVVFIAGLAGAPIYLPTFVAAYALVRCTRDKAI